ncbi:hypothetical protein [Salinicola avicenniae]|uniref:hypothetical protein n=1 Tax=Salinicola avicenniae TaxID=2916836 RepID=UPI00207491C0|nr:MULTISPECIES: hypothetical protein [unclassified Salinicola]
MPEWLARRQIPRTWLSGSLALLIGLMMPLAQAAERPAPFAAQYHLDISGWPDATITHRLSHDGDVWESEMQASIAIASGEERGRFRLEGDTVQALDYRSTYSLAGIGDEYHRDREQLAALPDRQTALFALSRQAPDARCASSQVSPCELQYQNHKGEEETLYYRVESQATIATPAGDFPGVTVDTWDPEKRDRHLYFSFHREIPGLLLKLRYVRDGEEKSHLDLTRLQREESTDAP